MINVATTIGYYVTCDDAECEHCFTKNGGNDEWKRKGGFEDWDSPIAIFPDTESDTPTHCCECHSIIEHDLTSEGLDYVSEHIVEGFSEGKKSEVVAEWIKAYGDYLEEYDDKPMSVVIELYSLLPDRK